MLFSSSSRMSEMVGCWGGGVPGSPVVRLGMSPAGGIGLGPGQGLRSRLGFSKQEHCSGLPFPPPGDLPDPGIKPTCLASPALAGGFFTTEPPGKAHSKEQISHDLGYLLLQDL